MAGGKLAGLVALLLDISKAAVPVGFAYFNLGIRGVPMFLIAVAPVLGHVFSPFLNLRGGKALSTALGVWIGLTIWKAALPGVITALGGLALFTRPGWAVMFWEPLAVLVLLLFGRAPQARVGELALCIGLSTLIWLIPYWVQGLPLGLAFLYPVTLLANEVAAFQSLWLSLTGRLTWKNRSLARPNWKWL